jgi:hypothetical protein
LPELEKEGGLGRADDISVNYDYFTCVYVGVLISLWLFVFPVFLFAAQPKEFFFDVLKKLEQRSHKYVELKGNM